ncbi:MAG: START domain-containing protein [Bacteroidota bacterium]
MPLFLGVLSTSLWGQSAWELQKDQEGIQIYTRKVGDSKFKAYKAVTTIDVPVSNLLAVLKDPAHYDDWMPDTAVKLLSTSGDSLQIHYALSYAPWPIRDRDGIYRMLFQRKADGEIQITVNGIPDYLPKEKKRVRIPYAQGLWRFQPREDGKVDLNYEFHADPGGSLPAWIVNKATVDMPFEIIKGLREQSQLAAYYGKSYSF